jgi:phage pi2 protein 07
MKINIGDKVRFLNSVGGGTVTAFHGKNQVLVEDENGFDVPVLVAECVVVGASDRRMENREPEPYKPVAIIQKEEKKPEKEKFIFVETPQGERLNVNLAFLPTDPKSFMQSAFESYIINESNYYLFINYMICKNNSWTSKFNGVVEPDTKLFIEEFEKSELTDYEHICIQMTAFKKGKPFSLKNPASVELRLDTVKFYKLHCFTKNDFFDEDALIFPLITNDIPERQMLISASDIQEALNSKKDDQTSVKQVFRKPEKENKTTEIDLHINQLIDTASGMSNAEILEYQISKFHEVMKANKGRKGQKIVFIHGKGEGVLRTAIEKELKTTYKNRSRFQDASFREYGYGATMVTIS